MSSSLLSPGQDIAAGADEESARAVVTAIARERQRLAHLLHDTVVQTFTGCSLLTRLTLRKAVQIAPELGSDLQELENILQLGLTELQDVVRSLSLQEHGGEGLREPLAEIARRAAEKIPCGLALPETLPEIEPHACLQLLHIVREAVEQAIRRPEATAVSIDLVEEGTSVLTISVSDNGRGTTPVEQAGLLPGLDLLRYRARVIGATLQIDSAGDRGTTVSCRLPLSEI